MDKLFAGFAGVVILLNLAWWAFVITVIVLVLSHFGVI